MHPAFETGSLLYFFDNQSCGSSAIARTAEIENFRNASGITTGKAEGLRKSAVLFLDSGSWNLTCELKFFNLYVMVKRIMR